MASEPGTTVVVKSLSNVRREFAMADGQTVADLRKLAIDAFGTKIAGTKRPPMLIHNGKILKDDKPISTCDIKPRDVVVFMAQRMDPVPAGGRVRPVAASSIPPEPVAAVENKQAGPNTNPMMAMLMSMMQSNGTAGRPRRPTTTTNTNNNNNAAAVVSLMELAGCDRPSAERALAVGRGDVTAAVDILLNRPELMRPAVSTAATVTTTTTNEPASMNDDDDDDERTADDEIPENGPRTISVSMTPADMAVVARLESYGFSRNQVVEAYLVCDRNEELATNYLLQSIGPR